VDISLLDQSILRPDASAGDTLAETITCAKAAESLGYARFWVSEHHDSPIIAGSSPEVLLAAVGAATARIRLGSGGVMLPHYSPFKVAENFAVLSNLYPGRMDLGVGRAPGADMRAAAALAVDGQPRFDRFPQQLKTLTEALWEPGHRPRVSPVPAERIPVWLLGTSHDSALLAAELGLPYAIALFINPRFDPRIADLYRSRFRPSPVLAEPRVMIAMNILCADDPDAATAMAHAADLTYISFLRNPEAPRMCSPAEARAHVFSPEERAFVQGVSAARATGTAAMVHERVTGMAAHFGAAEIMAVSNTFHLSDRLRSLELLAGAFGAKAA
jgi:luciferase family oxidoreductase group 1